MVNQPDPDKLPKFKAGRWPWQRSLQYRIILVYGGVFLVILVVLSLVVGQITFRAQLDAAENDLELAAFLAANALEDPLSGYSQEFTEFRKWEEHSESGEEEDDDDEKEHGSDAPLQSIPTPTAMQATLELPRLQQVTMVYANDTNARVTILDPRGRAIADSLYPIEDIDNQLDQTEVQAALTGTIQHEVRSQRLSAGETLFVAAPIQQGSELLGVVQMSRPMNDIMEAIRRVQVQILVSGITALLVATLLGVWIGRRLVSPLRQLEQAAMTIATGDLNHKVESDRKDELGALAYAFNFMVDEVRRMLEQQRTFVANASHELRTPLTNIKLRSETLRSLGNSRPDITERYLEEIDHEADRLGRLANNLLDLSRLQQSGDYPLPADGIDIRPIVLSAAKTMALRAEKSGVHLVVSLPESMPELRIWPDQLEAILINLIDNAIKYTPEHGEVLITVTRDQDELSLSIRDSGHGIPTDDLPHIFDPFYRVDKARSRNSEDSSGIGSSVGLGLSIVKTLVQQNSGSIRVASSPQEGSDFIITFPLSHP